MTDGRPVGDEDGGDDDRRGAGGPGGPRAGADARRATGGAGGRGAATVSTVVAVLLVAGLLVVVGSLGSAYGLVPAPGVGVDVDLDGDGDDDGLRDDRERRFGTDPGNPDTDGDRLLDGWEVRDRTPGGARLPDADPRHKDLYVQVAYGAEVASLTAAERRQIRAVWAGMDVPNPDGHPGVDVHLVPGPDGGRLDRPAVFDGTENWSAVTDRYYTRERLGPRRCVYRLLVFAVVDDGTTVGYGDSPGYLAVVDGTRRGQSAGGADLTYRGLYAVHELLHNVVGRLPGGGHHTDSGWLSHGAVRGPGDAELADPTRRTLAEGGFADPVGYRERCDR